MKALTTPIKSCDCPSQFLSPKQPPTGNNRQTGERQTEGHTHHKAEKLDPSRYDDNGQNVGDENVGVELDGVRHEAGGLSLMGLDCNPTPERAPDLLSHRLKH